MYKKVYLTDPRNNALALENMQFDDCFLLREDIYPCENAKEALKVVNSHDPLIPFSILRDNSLKTILANKDRLGNIHYLVLVKS